MACLFDEEFAGYVTLSWNSLYEPFKAQGIPEIMDLNVLPPYRNKGVGSALLDVAECEASKRVGTVGLGVGLYADYGAAQRLYVARGYLPDGLGVTYNYSRIIPGGETVDDDDLVLWCAKKVSSFRFPYTLIDLTHGLSSKVPYWDICSGFECKSVCDYADIGFRVHRIEMMAGTGTHMDAPSHVLPEGITIADIPLEMMVSPCVVIDVSAKVHERYSVLESDIVEFERNHGVIPSSSLVIIRTGWDRFWNEPEKYRNNLVFPSISKEAASVLLKRDIHGLGIDTLSSDRPEDGFCVHKMFAKSGKYLIENVANTHLLQPVGCYSMCFPVKIEGAAEAPVRLIALIPHKK